jgi:hypothetical protein
MSVGQMVFDQITWNLQRIDIQHAFAFLSSN